MRNGILLRFNGGMSVAVCCVMVAHCETALSVNQSLTASLTSFMPGK